MITSAKHPVYAASIANLPIYNPITRAWARWQLYCAIMISAGPILFTIFAKDHDEMEER